MVIVSSTLTHGVVSVTRDAWAEAEAAIKLHRRFDHLGREGAAVVGIGARPHASHVAALQRNPTTREHSSG